MTPEEVLLKAADEIARYGLHKGNYALREDPDSPVCALGGIKRAVYGSVYGFAVDEKMSVEGAAVLKLENSIKKQGYEPECKQLAVIPMWNDEPETTAEDVILAMKKAAHGE